MKLLTSWQGRSRSLLVLASMQGVVCMLLAAGANANAIDAQGCCALLAAVRRGHEAVITRLVSAKARLQLSAAELSCALCAAVAEGDTSLLERFIAAGADVSVGDYNQQTALHVAATQGKINLVSVRMLCQRTEAGLRVLCCVLPADVWSLLLLLLLLLFQVKLLVEQGRADVSAVDRFGRTPLAEAHSVGAAEVAAYLSSVGSSSCDR